MPTVAETYRDADLAEILRSLETAKADAEEMAVKHSDPMRIGNDYAFKCGVYEMTLRLAANKLRLVIQGMKK